MKINVASYVAVFTFVNLLAASGGHTWLECTDYRFTEGTTDASIWNKDKCFGHARCGARQASAGFGVDTGFNYHSGQGCQCSQAPDNYAGISIATYQPGQLVCLAYPPKTHVAAECTNPFIPDHGVVITRAPLYDDSSAISSYKHLNGDHQTGVVDYKGFQRCPRFCEDIQGALCTMCFQLENDIAPGNYTFRWVWSFNSAEDAYSSCWEASVTNAGSISAPTSVPGTTAATLDTGAVVESSPSNSSTFNPSASIPTPSNTSVTPSVPAPSNQPSTTSPDALLPTRNKHHRHRKTKMQPHNRPAPTGTASTNTPCILPPQNSPYSSPAQ